MLIVVDFYYIFSNFTFKIIIANKKNFLIVIYKNDIFSIVLFTYNMTLIV